jgi:putative sterol carrier protein
MTGEDVLQMLAAGAPYEAIGHARGTVRIDVVDDGVSDRWWVTLRDGSVTVAREEAPADAVLRADRSTMNAVLTGSVDPITAVLRGEMIAEGDLVLLALFQRLIPETPRALPSSRT